MKKFITLILALVIILSTSVSAFAFSKMPFTSNIDSVKYAILEAMCGDGYLDWPLMADPSLGMLEVQGADLVEISMDNLDDLIYRANARGLTTTKYEYKSGYYCAVIERKLFYPNNTGDKYYTWGNDNGFAYIAKGTPSETTYAVSAIAGVSTYFITPRPVGTVGNGYLGDLCISRDNYNTVKSTLNNLGDATSYYTILFSVDGEIRYYLATAFGGTRYFVCNRAGQLYYTLKDEPEDVSGTTGGTFDASEVIAAINSVYNKLDSGFCVVTESINETNNRITSLNDDFILHMNNTVSGLSAANGTLNTIADYLSGLMNKQIIERTVIYRGTDIFLDLPSDLTIADVAVNIDDGGATNSSQMYIKESYGEVESAADFPVMCNSTYISVTYDVNGFPVFTANHPLYGGGIPRPNSTVLYYEFDDDVNSCVGESTITVTGTEQYAEGVHGQAYVFSENTSALTGVYSTSTNLFNAENGAYTISTWLYPTGSPTSGYFQFRIGGAKYMTIRMGTTGQLDVSYYSTTTTVTTVSTGRSFTTNEWNHIAVCYDGETLYIFLNGELCHMEKTTVIRPTGDDFKIFSSTSGKVPIGTMVDEFVITDGDALWTSSFDPYDNAIFADFEYDLVYACGWPALSQRRKIYTMPNVYYTETRDWHENAFNHDMSSDNPNYYPEQLWCTSKSRSYIHYDVTSGEWMVYDCLSNREFLCSDIGLDGINQFNFYVRDNYVSFPLKDVNSFLVNKYVVGRPVWLDIPDGGTITVTYLEYVNWFDSIYSLIDMQSDQLTAIVQKMDNATGDTIINIENTVVDITQDSDAFNIFYVEKTDGTTESVGETATDAAKVVGEFLSIFYRLVFEDAFSNADIMHDFEDVYTVTASGVNVW